MDAGWTGVDFLLESHGHIAFVADTGGFLRAGVAFVGGGGGRRRPLSLVFARGGWGALRLAYQRLTQDFDILRAEISGEDSPAHVLKPSEPFIASTRSEVQPQYSPDGSRVAFVSDRSGDWEFWTCNSDRS